MPENERNLSVAYEGSCLLLFDSTYWEQRCVLCMCTMVIILAVILFLGHMYYNTTTTPPTTPSSTPPTTPPTTLPSIPPSTPSSKYCTRENLAESDETIKVREVCLAGYILNGTQNKVTADVDLSVQLRVCGESKV